MPLGWYRNLVVGRAGSPGVAHIYQLLWSHESGPNSWLIVDPVIKRAMDKGLRLEQTLFQAVF